MIGVSVRKGSEKRKGGSDPDRRLQRKKTIRAHVMSKGMAIVEGWVLVDADMRQ